MSLKDLRLGKTRNSNSVPISSMRSLKMKPGKTSNKSSNTHTNKNDTPSKNVILDSLMENKTADKSIVTCEKCESSYLVNNKSARKWICAQCNVIIFNGFPNTYNNIQEQSVAIPSLAINTNIKGKKPVLKGSFSSSIVDQIACVIIERDSDIEYDSECISDTDIIQDKNYLNNTSYRRNISRSVSLCDMDSISTLSGLNHTNSMRNTMDLSIDIYNTHRNKIRKTGLSPNKLDIHKIRQKPTIKKSQSEWIFTKEYEETYHNDDTEHKLQLDNSSMSALSDTGSETQSMCSEDSIIANKSYSPSMESYNEQKHRNVKITRTQSNGHKPKGHKSKYSKWVPPLNILSELSTWSEQTQSRRENPLAQVTQRHNVNVNNNINVNTNVNINEQHGYALKPSETMPCDVSDSAEVAYEEYVNGEYGFISPYSDKSSPLSYSMFDNMFTNDNKDAKPLTYYSNKYQYNADVQRALHVAYLTGFNEGYSMGCAFKLTALTEQSFK